MTDPTTEAKALADARHMHRPAMSSGEAVSWVLGWTFALGTLWCVALGFVLGTYDDDGRVGAVAVAVGALVQLLLPGVGLRRPGGARAPTILRASLTMSALWAAAWMGALYLAAPRDPGRNPAEVVWTLGIFALLGTPLVGVSLAYKALVGRGPVRSAALGWGAGLLALAGIAWPVARALVPPPAVFDPRHAAQGPAWGVASALFGVAALISLGRSAMKRDALDPSRWIDGRVDGGMLRLGDDARPAPGFLAGYAGPVCAYAPRVPASAPGRGAAPIPPDALLACDRAQLPMLLTDLRDGQRALSLFLATVGALAALVPLLRAR